MHAIVRLFELTITGITVPRVKALCFYILESAYWISIEFELIETHIIFIHTVIPAII